MRRRQQRFTYMLLAVLLPRCGGLPATFSSMPNLIRTNHRTAANTPLIGPVRHWGAAAAHLPASVGGARAVAAEVVLDRVRGGMDNEEAVRDGDTGAYTRCCANDVDISIWIHNIIPKTHNRHTHPPTHPYTSNILI